MLKVSIITPTTADRAEFNERIKRIAKAQDYPNIEHILCYDNGSIGTKRNRLCDEAKGDIIVMFDSDDFYSTDFIYRSYQHLVSTKADVVGLSCAYFYQPHTKMWRYDYIGVQKYVIGSGMMFYKSVWERNPFPDKNIAEDAGFLANAGRIIPHNYTNGFIAMIHGNNTASHHQTPYMKRIDINIAKNILGAWYEFY